jgi:predicted nucleic acid-binding protein
VVLAEYLYGLHQAEWQAQSAAIIAGNFYVAPLSHQAAIKAADNRRKFVGKQHERAVARGSAETK